MCLIEGKEHDLPIKKAPLSSSADGSALIQSTSASVPSTPCWCSDMALNALKIQRARGCMAASLRTQSILTTIREQGRVARRRFGRDEVSAVAAVLFGYAVRSQRTVEAFRIRS
jgi:hypothetical protein